MGKEVLKCNMRNQFLDNYVTELIDFESSLLRDILIDQAGNISNIGNQ